MNYLHVWAGLWLLIHLASPLSAQDAYPVHSHNDYRQAVPFWHAYASGAASIEVDLLLKNDTLFVTHEAEEIETARTFSRLYLDPINQLAEDGTLRPIQLLIDLKTEAYATIDRVVEAIEHYPGLPSAVVTFVISGNRPAPADYGNYPDFIYFDHQRIPGLEDIDLSKVALISQPFRPYSVWNGLGRMTAADSARVSTAIERVKKTGKPFRFWGTPDTRTAWACFAKLGVGYINTDKPGTARQFLDKLDHNTFGPQPAVPTYAPQYNIAPGSKPKNIILMIGDGNGLAQISAARMANQGQLSLTNIRDIGLLNTASADDPVTDSAGAGTAIATGVKARNRAIGVGPSGQSQPTLVEILSQRGYRAGIITTDGINGATPSSFYAHTAERDDADKIISDLVNSDLDFFIAGGQWWEEELSPRFASRSLTDFTDLDEPTAVYNGARSMPSVNDGRGDFLPRSVKQALTVLQAGEEPFFLLIEGAQIDKGGHANNVNTVITEMLDFDRAVAEALRFADADGETLVIVTADHETGGLGIVGGDMAGTVRADFLSVDHSGTLVPLFAYGPRSSSFTGVFDNTEVFHRIMAALETGNERR
jgi:alkaline phosphatase